MSLQIEGSELIVEILEASLERLAVAVAGGDLDLAQDAGALEKETVAFAEDFDLFRLQDYPVGSGAPLFGFLLLLLYVFAFEASGHSL